MQPQDIIKLYNSILDSHKALPKDAQLRLAQGETIIIVNGTEERWTSRLAISKHENTYNAHMTINHELPMNMAAQLKEKQKRFEAQMRETQRL